MTRINEIVELFPRNYTILFMFSAENATIAVAELAHALNNSALKAPFTNIGDKQIEAIHQLANIFQKTAKNECCTKIKPSQHQHIRKINIQTSEKIYIVQHP